MLLKVSRSTYETKTSSISSFLPFPLSYLLSYLLPPISIYIHTLGTDNSSPTIYPVSPYFPIPLIILLVTIIHILHHHPCLAFTLRHCLLLLSYSPYPPYFPIPLIILLVTIIHILHHHPCLAFTLRYCLLLLVLRLLVIILLIRTLVHISIHHLKDIGGIRCIRCIGCIGCVGGIVCMILTCSNKVGSLSNSRSSGCAAYSGNSLAGRTVNSMGKVWSSPI